MDDLTERGRMRGMGDEDLARVLHPAVQLAEQNLPSEMIFQKAMEGIAKGVPPAIMDRVLNQIRTGTEQARPLIDEWIAKPDVEQMVERSTERMDRETFRNEMLRVSARAVSGETGLDLVLTILETLGEEGVMRNATPSRVLAAINILSDIPNAAQQPEQMRDMIAKAIQHGFTSSDLQRLPAAMNMAQRRSELPAAAVMQGLGQQMDRGVPAADILQNLFNGDVRGGGPPGHIPPGLQNRPDRGEGHPGRGGQPVLPGHDGVPGQGDPGQSGTPGQGQGPR